MICDVSPVAMFVLIQTFYLYTRQREDNSGAEGKREDNALYKHMQLFHPNQASSFVFEAEKFFKDVASHQIFEGVCINNSPSTPGYLMNSRAEFEQGSVARVVVAHGLWKTTNKQTIWRIHQTLNWEWVKVIDLGWRSLWWAGGDGRSSLRKMLSQVRAHHPACLQHLPQQHLHQAALTEEVSLLWRLRD